jgi:hypothetical protein
VQVNLETKLGLAWGARMTATINVHVLVLRFLVEEMFGICLLGWVRCEQAGAVGVFAPDGGSIGSEQFLKLGIQTFRIGGKVEQGISLLGQLFAQLGDFTRQLAIIRVVELWNAAVGGGARGRQAQAQALCNFAYGGIMRTEDADPARPIPAAPRHARDPRPGCPLSSWRRIGDKTDEKETDGDVDGKRTEMACDGVAPKRG